MRTETERLPGIDERAVMPGSGIELLDGKVLSVPGADPPHATRHLSLAYVLGAHVAPGFVGALDMLTRAALASDFAPDASVYPEGADPQTGERRLDVLAFEIVSEQRLSVATAKARALSARGVRRVFALSLARSRVLEWVSEQWRPMHIDESISDECLGSPLPVRALLETAGADEAVLAALQARRPDLVANIEARGRAEGEAAMRDAIAALCEVLGVPITPARATRIGAADLDDLRTMSHALRTGRRWPRD